MKPSASANRVPTLPPQRCNISDASQDSVYRALTGTCAMAFELMCVDMVVRVVAEGKHLRAETRISGCQIEDTSLVMGPKLNKGAYNQRLALISSSSPPHHESSLSNHNILMGICDKLPLALRHDA